MNMSRQVNARQLREHSKPEVQNEDTNAGDFVIAINQVASICEDADDVKTTQPADSMQPQLKAFELMPSWKVHIGETPVMKDHAFGSYLKCKKNETARLCEKREELSFIISSAALSPRIIISSLS